MAEGLIVKALSGFYYVQSEHALFQCRGRGNFRKRNIKPLVGDRVRFEAENETDGYVLEVFPRTNELNRPPIANIDQALLVFSAEEPEFSSQLLDRFLVHIEFHQIEPVIIISKIDLLTEQQLQSIKAYQHDYQNIGYRLVLTSMNDQESVQQVIPLLEGKVSVVAGQSGVGKSSLLNAINPEFTIETAQISAHLGRGKHTTRHVELLPVGTGLVADTPGFSSLDFTAVKAEQLTFLFPEIAEMAARCKFRGCSHTSEPNCAVLEAVEASEILPYRYQHYVQFLDEIKSKKRRYDS